jgi:cytochrome c oxidase subunit III
MKTRIVGDLSELEEDGFGPRATTWWGTMGFMALEGMGFVLAAGALLYLYAVNPDWPLSAPLPDYGPGTVIAIVMVLSLIPNHLVLRWAKQKAIWKVRLGLVVMSILGIIPLVIRVYEFPALNVNYDANAYGSILWFLLGLHTTHLLTDVGETVVLTVLMFTKHGHVPRRFGDVDDNAFYWDFVVLTWLPIYALIYWIPRL